LNDVTLRAGTSGEVWIANVSSKELAGELAWRPDGWGASSRASSISACPTQRPKERRSAAARLAALDIIPTS